MRPAQIFFEKHEGLVRAYLEEIGDFVLSQHPAITEERKFKTAFYIYKGWLCYLGYRKHHIIIGFVDGVHLSNSDRALRADEGQTQIRQIKIKPGESIPFEIIQNNLQEALLYKDEVRKAKSRQDVPK